MGITTALLVLTHIAMYRKSPAFSSLLEDRQRFSSRGRTAEERPTFSTFAAMKRSTIWIWIARWTYMPQATNLPSS
jgi:hypothetical protein